MRFGNRLALLTGFALLLFAFLGPACTAKQVYVGEERERDDVAVIKVPYYPKGLFITIDRIDTGKVEGEAYDRYAVLPGRHVLAGRARGFGQPKVGSPYTIEFVAEPDATYILSLSQSRFSEKLHIAVVDEETSDEVATIDILP